MLFSGREGNDVLWHLVPQEGLETYSEVGSLHNCLSRGCNVLQFSLLQSTFSPRALLQSMFASRHIDLFGEVWQPVLIINNREVKRHVVGKECIRHYAADRVLASYRDHSELLCLWLHQNTLWRVETQSSTGILVNQNVMW